MKVYICCKTLSNRIRIRESALKNLKPKTIKVMKVLCVKCAPVTVIAKGIVIAHNNRCLWSDMETITDFCDQWIRNILNKIETK